MKEIQKDGGEMKRETFIKQIKNGEITDFSKYLAVENRQIWYRVEMAKLGVCVEELAQMGEQRVQAALVENGYAKQYYQQWAREDQKDVVYELVRKGYCTDILENSKHDYVLIKLIGKGLAKHKWTEWAKSASYSVKLELLRYEEFAQIMVHDSIDEIRTRAVRQYPKLVNGSVQTKWAMKHGHSQPISVISDFDLVAENVSNINPNNTLTMIVTDDGYERKQYTVEDGVKVREQTLENGTLTLHYDNQSQIRSLRELYR